MAKGIMMPRRGKKTRTKKRAKKAKIRLYMRELDLPELLLAPSRRGKGTISSGRVCTSYGG
jgi:hypothetical protein